MTIKKWIRPVTPEEILGPTEGLTPEEISRNLEKRATVDLVGLEWTPELEKWWAGDRWTEKRLHEEPQLAAKWQEWDEIRRALFKYWRVLFSNRYAIQAAEDKLWPPHMLDTPIKQRNKTLDLVQRKRAVHIRYAITDAMSRKEGFFELDYYLDLQNERANRERYTIWYEVYR